MQLSFVLGRGILQLRVSHRCRTWGDEWTSLIVRQSPENCKFGGPKTGILYELIPKLGIFEKQLAQNMATVTKFALLLNLGLRIDELNVPRNPESLKCLGPKKANSYEIVARTPISGTESLEK